MSLSVSKNHFFSIFGIFIFMLLWNIKLPGLSSAGQQCLALTLMTIIFWAGKVAHMGFISILLLASFAILKLEDPSKIFSLWTTPTAYLVIGAYLLSSVVSSSGLGERIAYNFTLKFINSFKSLIISCYLLQIILGLLIPHPWPKSFLILSVMALIIKNSNLNKRDASIIGLSIFASSIPAGMVFLTSDSLLNSMALSFYKGRLGWLEWFYYMGIPALAAVGLTYLVQSLLFPSNISLEVDKEAIISKLKNMGPMTSKEKKALMWIIIAILLWMTDSIHGIHIGWITLVVVSLMSFPVIGDLLNGESWKVVPLDIILFLSATIAIGVVGGSTGMNQWLADTFLPSHIPDNIFMLTAIITGCSLFLHMFMGSVSTVLGVAVPAFLGYISKTDINPIFVIFLVYTSVTFHYILPFHQITMFIGMGDNSGMYTEKDVLRMGLGLTIALFILTICIQVPWWKITGLI